VGDEEVASAVVALWCADAGRVMLAPMPDSLVHIALAVALAALVGLGCHAPSTGDPLPAPPSAAPPPVTPQAPKHTGEPAKFDLVEDKDVNVGSGVTVRLKSVMYAHLEGSRNDSLLTMDVTRGGKRESVTLNRLSPGEPIFKPVMGLMMAIDYVDAYQKPVTGAILVKGE
jgi:hypothetical protein